MKKITILLGAALIASTGFAQSTEQGNAYAKSSKTINKVNGFDKTPTDTLGWNNNSGFLPAEFAIGGQAVNFGYTGGGYIYGVNVSGLEINHCAQGYLNINQTTFGVEGVIAWFSGKDGVGGGNSTITFNLYNMAMNSAKEDLTFAATSLAAFTQTAIGPTGSPIATTTMPFSAADTANIISYAQFPTITVINGGDFAVSMDAQAVKAANDTVGLVSDQDGEGFNLAFHHIGGSQNVFFVTNSLFGGTVNNNIALWPVIDANFVGVEDYEFFNNMQLSAYPNPAVNNATIAYNLNENMDNVKLVVYDMTGREVYNETYGAKTKGSYKINLDASNLNAGNYFYSLIANGNRLTKRMVIAK